MKTHVIAVVELAAVLDGVGVHVESATPAGLQGPADEVLRWQHREAFRGERSPATAPAAAEPPRRQWDEERPRPRWDDDRGGQ